MPMMGVKIKMEFIEYVAALDPANDDVVESAGRLYSGFSWHGKAISGPSSS